MMRKYLIIILCFFPAIAFADYEYPANFVPDPYGECVGNDRFIVSSGGGACTMSGGFPTDVYCNMISPVNGGTYCIGRLNSAFNCNPGDFWKAPYTSTMPSRTGGTCVHIGDDKPCPAAGTPAPGSGCINGCYASMVIDIWGDANNGGGGLHSEYSGEQCTADDNGGAENGNKPPDPDCPPPQTSIIVDGAKKCVDISNGTPDPNSPSTSDPSTDSSTDPSTDSSTDPSTDSSTNPSTNPSTGPSTGTGKTDGDGEGDCKLGDLFCSEKATSDPAVPGSADFDAGFFSGTFDRALAWQMPSCGDSCQQVTFNFPLFRTSVTMTAHCDIARDVLPYLKGVCMAVWAMMAFFIVMKA